MRLASYRPSKKTVFAALMAISAVAVLLPPHYADAAKHTTQLLAPLQDLAYSATHWAAHTLPHDAESQADNDRTDAMMRHLVSQAGLIEQLEAENERLGAVRSRAIPRALAAQVIAHDIAQWRSSLLLERGAELGVHRKDWATTRLFLNEGYLNDVAQNQAVIAREILLGRIEFVSPYTSRVQLFADIDCPPTEVRVGGLRGELFAFVEYPCILRGTGRGEMIIRDVDYRFVDNEIDSAEDDGTVRIRVGDHVCSSPGQLGLPQPMVIGFVTAIVEDPNRRLVFDLKVEPAVDVANVRHVHIVPLIPTELALE